MRDVPAIVFLSQTASESLDSLARAPWWAVMILALLGGTAGIAKAWSVLSEYLKDKRDLARRLADEDKLRRDAKAKAEVDQLEALTSMARDVPKRLDQFASELSASNRILAQQVEANTRALVDMRSEIASDTRALVMAIAGKLGVQTSADETNPSGGRRQSIPEQRASHPSLL
jgi:hypothetical protein